MGSSSALETDCWQPQIMVFRHCIPSRQGIFAVTPPALELVGPSQGESPTHFLWLRVACCQRQGLPEICDGKVQLRETGDFQKNTTCFSFSPTLQIREGLSARVGKTKRPTEGWFLNALPRLETAWGSSPSPLCPVFCLPNNLYHSPTCFLFAWQS